MPVEKSLNCLKAEENVRLCLDCGCDEMMVDGSELFCKKCGLVLD